MSSKFIVLCTLLTVIACAQAAQPAQSSEPPKLTARPQNIQSGLVLTSLDEKEAFKRSQAAIGQLVGGYVLLDREARPVPLSRYRGKPLLVNFIYTACFQVCPTTTRNLQKALENAVATLGAERFSVVSIGFNQPFDSPPAMKSFASQHGIRLPNWEFLSPAQAIVSEVAGNFGFSFVATAAGFDHLNQVTIVDAEGKIVRQVYGEKFTAEDIVEPLKLMVTGAPLPARASKIDELIERVRILCSVYDPVTGRYRTNYALYFEIAGFLSFVGFMGWVAYSFMLSKRNKAG
jgi:protein SCO1/2